MSALPNGWHCVKLCQVADKIQYGYTSTSSLEAEGPHYLRITDIQDSRVEWLAVPRVAASQDVIDHYRLAPGDIVFARSGATVGKSFLVPDQAEESVFASYLIRVRCNAKSIYPPFAAKYFHSPAYWTQIVDGASGTGQPNFNATKLSQIDVPLPPVPEQRRIVAKLDSLTAARASEELGRIPKLFQKYREAILSDVFSDGCTGSKLVRLADAVAQIRTGPFGSTLHKHEYIRGGIPLVNPMHIDDGKIIPSQDMTLTNTKAAQLKEFKLKSGDVIIGRRGVMGRCAVVTSEQAGWLLGTGSIAITPSATLDPPYLQRFLSCPQTVTNLKQHAVGSTMVNLNQDILLNLKIPLPSIQEQQERIRRIETAFSWLDHVATEHANASRLLPKLDQAILAKAFRGELVLSDRQTRTLAAAES